MRGHWLAPLTVTAVALLLGMGPVVARADGPSGARSELERGYELRRKGNYVEALPHLLESYRLDPQMKTLINLADSEEHVGKLVDARVHWKAALAQASPREAEIRLEAQRRITALDGRIPTLKISFAADAPPSCVVELDGVALPTQIIGVFAPTDPGRRAIVVRAPGHENKTFEVILETAESREVLVKPGPELAPPPSPAPAPAPMIATQPEPTERSPASSGTALKVSGIAVASVGVVGIGIGTFFGVSAISKKNQADCPGNVCTGPTGQPATLHDAVGAGNVATVFLVAGAALAVGGVTLWLIAPKRGRTTGLAAAPTVSTRAGGLALAGTW